MKSRRGSQEVEIPYFISAAYWCSRRDELNIMKSQWSLIPVSEEWWYFKFLWKIPRKSCSISFSWHCGFTILLAPHKVCSSLLSADSILSLSLQWNTSMSISSCLLAASSCFRRDSSSSCVPIIIFSYFCFFFSWYFCLDFGSHDFFILLILFPLLMAVFLFFLGYVPSSHDSGSLSWFCILFSWYIFWIFFPFSSDFFLLDFVSSSHESVFFFFLDSVSSSHDSFTLSWFYSFTW